MFVTNLTFINKILKWLYFQICRCVQIKILILIIPLIPVNNENGDFFMYDDLKNFGTSDNGILDYTAYASNPMAHMVYNQAGKIRIRILI